ncbi:hypothetical protein pclt_cds_561 [Pandoravirus celtis]|uniref:F-box incomplete domain containing protein n=1 Tax=Pandoravirus celtis TaxID=2568002 RepID=A0A4D6EHH3_9VIRU|nr:hypothetical protein pclt_cds_561 [Pandoravirus celtis]
MGRHHGPTGATDACHTVPPPTDPTPPLPPEVWALILVDALDLRWHFAARAVCHLWHDLIDTGPTCSRRAEMATTAPHPCAMVRASSILAWRPHNDPATLVAFCLSSAGCTRDALSVPARPLCRRDVLLGLVASGDTVLVDYALGDLAQCLASSVHCISAACVCIGHGSDGNANCSRRHRTTCLYDKNGQGDQRGVGVVDTAFYRRATSLAMRAGGIHLLQRVMLCLDGFDPLRHIDPVDVISTDCVGALALIDPPSGAFWREGYAVPLRAFAVPAVWCEAGRTNAAAIIARLLDDSADSDAQTIAAHANNTHDPRVGVTVLRTPLPSALRGPCPTMAARAAVVYGNTRVLDVLAARSGIGAVSTARGLDDLVRRAAAACSTHGFAWCRTALVRIGANVDIVGAACDAVMGPWIENGPRIAWDTDTAVRFLEWLYRPDGGGFASVLTMPGTAREIIRCAGHPRRFPSDDHQGNTTRHAHAVAAFLESRLSGTLAAEIVSTPTSQ